MVTNISMSIERLFNGFYFPQMNITDMVEILIIICGLYYLLKHLHNTRAWIFIKGMFAFLGVYAISYICGFNAITVIFEKSAYFFLIGAIFILQPELRKLFETIGIKKMKPFVGKAKDKNKFESRFSIETANSIADACKIMGEHKTGALIVLEKDIPLQDYINSGIFIDAVITKELILNTFEHNTPLHDGAVIISRDRLVAATCYLPLSKNFEINKAYGTRHRAAIGMSEATDAFTIIVSEETGHITVAYSNKLYENLSSNELLEMLYEFQHTSNELKKKTLRQKIFNNFGLKAFSIIFAILSWFVLTNAYDPLTNITFNNIPITVTNESVLESAKKAYTLDNKTTAEIIVTDKRSVVESLTKEDIEVIADMNNLSIVNNIPLQVKINKAPNASITFKTEDIAKIKFEEIITKELPFTITSSGSATYGYYVNELKSNVATVSVTGPRSKINMIGKIVANVDINGISAAFNTSVIPVVYDVNDTVLKDVTIVPGNIYVSGTVYKTKTVDLKVQILSQDNLNYSITDFKYSPEQIKIAAKEDVLMDMNTLDIIIDLNIDKDKIVDNQYITEVEIGKYITNDVYLVNPEASIKLTLDIKKYTKKEMKISSSDIGFTNVPYNLKAVANFPDISMVIWVPEDWADTITIDELKPTIDLDHATIGVEAYPITFVSDLLKFEKIITAPVIITKK